MTVKIDVKTVPVNSGNRAWPADYETARRVARGIDRRDEHRGRREHVYGAGASGVSGFLIHRKLEMWNTRISVHTIAGPGRPVLRRETAYLSQDW